MDNSLNLLRSGNPFVNVSLFANRRIIISQAISRIFYLEKKTDNLKYWFASRPTFCRY